MIQVCQIQNAWCPAAEGWLATSLETQKHLLLLDVMMCLLVCMTVLLSVLVSQWNFLKGRLILEASWWRQPRYTWARVPAQCAQGYLLQNTWSASWPSVAELQVSCSWGFHGPGHLRGDKINNRADPSIGLYSAVWASCLSTVDSSICCELTD